MELEEGLAYAAQGRALLFLGAGFSWGATSLAGKPFLLGNGLGKALADEMGIPAEFALDDIADIYVSKHGAQALLSKLRNWYTARDVSKAHRTIAKLNWTAVYTTNYDDVFERACAEVGRGVVSYGGADAIGRQTKGSLNCVHLNGFVRTATEASIYDELKLTTTSYAAGAALNIEWLNRFRFDLHAAQAIFFVGYSLADLELRQLLTAEELKEKSFFVLKPDPDLAEAHRANLYGLPIAKGVDVFAEEVEAFLTTYVVPPDILPLSYCFRAYSPAATSDSVEDRHLFELMLSGRLRTEFIPPSYLGQIDYCGTRSAVEQCKEMLRPGLGVVYLSSSLGNGKTVAMAELKYAAITKGFSVFSLVERGPSLEEELHHILQQNGPKAVFVDNYPEWLDVLYAFRGRVDGDMVLVMSARTASHEALFERVSETIGTRDGVEFDLDHLDEAEMEWVSAYLDNFGFWNEMAGSGDFRKLTYLQHACDGQWSSILLKLFEAPQIVERLAGAFRSFNGDFRYRDALTKLFVLSVLGYQPSSPALITLCGDELLTRGFREDATVREIVNVQSHNFDMRSSVMSQYILRKVADPNRTVTSLIQLIKQVEQLGTSDYYWELFKMLVRFSSFNLIFSEENRGRSAMKVYEAIKTLGRCSRNPLFGLQYAIAALVAKDFIRCGTYFATAYSHAANLNRYDAFQIDNHYARFLLERAVDIDYNASDRMSPFREARKLLRPQFADEWRHYPYRVAANYFDFYTRFSGDLSSAELDEIRGAATEILERISSLPESSQRNRDVQACRAAQTKIVQAA